MGKGLTPLASTLILVAVSIALGAAVMTWGEEFIEERAEFAQEPAACEQASIAPISIQGVQTLCYTDSAIHAIIENTGRVHLSQLFIQVIANDVADSVIAADLDTHTAGKIFIDHDAAINGIPRQVRITPHLAEACPAQTITIEPVPPCN